MVGVRMTPEFQKPNQGLGEIAGRSAHYGRGYPPAGRDGAEGEEMTARGPAWTPEETGLLRSMAAAGESPTAIATLIKRTPDAVRKRAQLLKSIWPVCRRG